METYKRILQEGERHLSSLDNHIFDVLDVKQPKSSQAVMNLSTTISKLSPLVGNLIEFAICDFLNKKSNHKHLGSWYRQDPGFPDTIFLGEVFPNPGFEIKAWFPLSTEITARFKDSQKYFPHDQTYVALIAWLPEFIIFGEPKIISTTSISAASIAYYRDNHYNKPPYYIVLEPEDTTSRTINLQQTNMNGYRFQGNQAELESALIDVKTWGLEGVPYNSSREYQDLLLSLVRKYRYRLDTNFAKIDRIRHPEIDKFKTEVMNTNIHGRTISQWQKIIMSKNDQLIVNSLSEAFNLKF